MSDRPFTINDALQALAAHARGAIVEPAELAQALATAKREAEDGPRTFEDIIAIRSANLVVIGARIAYALERQYMAVSKDRATMRCPSCGCTIVPLKDPTCPVCAHVADKAAV